jgi:hypothetical protein
MKTADKVEKYFPGFIAFTDCTEQQIPRPVNKRKRKIFYSGKRKKHTVKNQTENWQFLRKKIGKNERIAL